MRCGFPESSAMKKLTDCTIDGHKALDRGKEGQQGTQQPMRRELWVAAGLLFGPWLIAVSLFQTEIRNNPIYILTLLPGLFVAGHIQGHLVRHFHDNHRTFEWGRPFSALGAANWITLLRACWVVALAGFLPMAYLREHELAVAYSWVPGILYCCISLADLLDGFVARRQKRETELGKRLDIETDAAGLLVASLLAVTLGRLPGIYLLVGAAYYPFTFGVWLRRKRRLPTVDLQPRPFARIVAGFQMGLVGTVLLPLFQQRFTLIAAVIFMLPLLSGFLRDWLVVSCRVTTYEGQKTSWEIHSRSFFQKFLPGLLRLILLVGGMLLLGEYDGLQVEFSWKLAGVFCCLSAAAGFLGRGTSLALILMLGSNQSHFGSSGISVLIFSAAAAIALIGTGSPSLWEPEEGLLYRRGRKGTTT